MRRPRALVTGASAGIGEAFAERLARDGYDLVVVARGADRLEALATRLTRGRGMRVEVLPADLTRDAELRAVEDEIAAHRLDLLINNAGFGTAGRLAELDVDREADQIRLNVLALVRLTRAALPGMIERGEGAIINVSSMAGLVPTAYMATYGATKAFVNSFTEAIHEEIRGSGVRIQLLQPGFIRTGFQEAANVDSRRVPGFAWMETAAVVDASLDSLARGTLIVVPGAGNRVVAGTAGLVPRRLSRRVLGVLYKRSLAD